MMLSLLPGIIRAQNAGGVFGPVVNAGHAALQYRITYNPKSDGMVNRIHYEESVSDAVMLRMVLQSRKSADRDFDTDFAQGEIFWQLTENDSRFQSGLRFDGRLRSDDRPHVIGIHWTNQYAVTKKLTLRGLVMNDVNIGENSDGSYGLQTRAAAIYNMNPAVISLELYNSHGFGEFYDQREDQHQIGPHLDYRFGDIELRIGALFGLTDGTPDREGRLWLMRHF